MDPKQMEILFNHKEICEKLFSGDLQSSFHLLEEKINQITNNSSMETGTYERIFLYSLNHCFYHYFLFLHNCSFCQCCYDNFRSFRLNDDSIKLHEEARRLLFSYYQCMAKDCNHHIAEACQFIQTHLAEKLSLERVAAQIYVNRCYLCQLFKENMQESFSEYITQKRLEQAQTLLKTSRFSIDEIAEQCGFSSSGYFSTVFRKYYGQSPRAYRKAIR